MPQSDCHIRICRKVKINLKGIGRKPDPRCHHRHFCIGSPLYGFPQCSGIVRNQNLFSKPNQEAMDALCKLFRRFPACPQLRVNGSVLNDRARYQLREHGHVSAEGNQVFLHRRFPPIHINDIGQCLKGIKGNPYGQRHMQHGKSRSCQAVYRFHRKIGIFEKSQ